MKHEKGFSLVELLIVLLIIGVIAQLAIPNLLRSRMAGNEGSAINTVRTIISAEMLFVTTVGGGKYGSHNGGAASAPIVAAAYYESMAPVGLLMGVLGYLLGNYAGLLCAYLLQIMV